MNPNRSLLVAVALVSLVSASRSQRYIDPNKGNLIYVKQGIMDGNLVRTIFKNHGEVAHHGSSPSGEWPKGTGHQYLDGVAVIVQCETRDSTGALIHPLETNYREFIRKDPVTGVPWGWEPLPGYARQTQNEPAMSNKPSTWPPFWPDRSADWNGQWNGFFGRGILNADLETYFRMDDAADKQYAYRPDPTDPARGGLGLQVAVRGFQWSQVLASEVIFWYYEITNVAKQDYTKTVFAQYVDWGIGGTDDSSDDAGLFDTQLDIAYAFDGDGLGTPGSWSPVGMAGYAFLESPGIIKDSLGNPHGLDDDDDGIVDESRDNDAGQKIVGKANIIAELNSRYSMSDFLSFYSLLTVNDVVAVQQGVWWTGDENANWRKYSDIDNDNVWEEGEPLNDDVGSDGLAPFDEAYEGPDADSTQGNGRPDQGEPNFGILDKDESDQIGLTGFSIFPVHFYELHNDEQNWNVLTTPIDTTGFQQLNDVNLGMYFSAGARRDPSRGFPGNLFPLRQLQTERFSMALLFGDDRNDLVRRKRTVQQIYNANYRFAKPPDKPLVNAIPGDHKVTLYWDNRAERSFDPFLQQFDFQGYRIYRSTEPSFLENLTITDAYGKATFHKPLAQFDLIDSIQGLHPIDINGVKFDLGSNTGLRHIYVDNDVQNGQTYYYAVVSYDNGFTTTTTDGRIDGIPPSECSAVIRADISGNVKPDINTAVVVPRVPSSGYRAPTVEGSILHAGPGTGTFSIEVLNPDSVKAGHTYQVVFTNSTPFQNGSTPSFIMTDVTDGRVLSPSKNAVEYPEETGIADGFIGYVRNDAAIAVIASQSKWTVGSSNLAVKVSSLQGDPGYGNVAVMYPADLEIRFSDQIVDTSTQVAIFDLLIPTKFTVWNVTENRKAYFKLVKNRSDSLFAPGNTLIIMTGDSLGKRPVAGNFRAAWRIESFIDTLAGPLQMPQPGDIYRIVTTKPFRTGESFQFAMRTSAVDDARAAGELASVAVVPNPYVGSASWEPQSLFRSGRGERRLYFIHLPARCTIRIYTVSGNLVHTLTRDAAIDDGQMSWNLVSRDGMDISYGLYVYHVEAPGLGEKIGTFAIIK